MNKRLIGFSETLEEQITKYATELELSFTEAVRQLVTQGLNPSSIDNSNSIDLTTLQKEIEQLKKDTGWFKADNTQSELGNLKLEVKELEKKMNVILASSKLFKKHIDDRNIHLVDK